MYIVPIQLDTQENSRKKEETPCIKSGFQTHFSRIPSLIVINFSMGLVDPLPFDTT